MCLIISHAKMNKMIEQIIKATRCIVKIPAFAEI